MPPKKSLVTTKPTEKTTENCTEVAPGNTKTGAPDKEKRYRMWAFTHYNMKKPVKFFEYKMQYLCYGKETCPTTGKLHWQGFMYLHNAKTMSTIKKKYNKHAHWAPCFGCAKDNESYCKKDNDWFEFGKRPRPGTRNDIKQVYITIEEGGSLIDCVREHGDKALKMYKAIDIYQETLLLENLNKYRNWMTTCDWIYGPTGVGKSHMVFENFNPITHYNKPHDSDWWDNYKGQEIVILNDFRGQIPYDFLLQLIDKWPVEVRRRGKAPFPFLAKHIYITTSLSPELCYPNRDHRDSIEQLLRRIKLINLYQQN